MHRFAVYFIFAVLVLQGVAAGTSAYGDDIDQERTNYLYALSAIRAGNTKLFQQLEQNLNGYVLKGYLDYYYLQDHIASTPPAELRAFIAQNEDAPISEMLRKKWLGYLAKKGDWKTFISVYQGVQPDSDLNCDRLGYLLRGVKDQTALMTEIGQLWLTGNSLPDACDPVFAAWRKAGYMTSDMVWQRIQLAMDQHNLTLAQQLRSDLAAKDRVWVDRWLAMYKNPQRELSDIRYPVETPIARKIIRQGIVKLAYIDPQQAMDTWNALKQKFQFFGEDDNYVLRWVGILAAQDHLPQAVDWLSAVSASPNDASLRHWRVRAALRAGQWQTGLRFIEALPPDEQAQSEWRYWRARMLQETGHGRSARRIFENLAVQRTYYGFLSADQIGKNYSMQHISIEATPEEVSAMLALPGIQMAKELFELGETVDARRQWAWTTRNMSDRDLQVAAVLARQWGWYDRAILTVSKSDNLNDLDLRFPLLYRNMIETNAQQNGLDPSWVYGILRQESAFVTDARSDAGALGLMQVMPLTGRLTGRLINLPIRSNSAILEVANNLRLGTTYLKNVLDANNGQEVLATAAYNAGPNRIKDWLPSSHVLDADSWVDTIPYRETRNYVKNVMGFTTVYAYRLGDNTFHLSQTMASVLPGDASTSSQTPASVSTPTLPASP